MFQIIMSQLIADVQMAAVCSFQSSLNSVSLKSVICFEWINNTAESRGIWYHVLADDICLDASSKSITVFGIRHSSCQNDAWNVLCEYFWLQLKDKKQEIKRLWITKLSAAFA